MAEFGLETPYCFGYLTPVPLRNVTKLFWGRDAERLSPRYGTIIGQALTGRDSGLRSWYSTDRIIKKGA